jgi:hypothetical protein
LRSFFLLNTFWLMGLYVSSSQILKCLLVYPKKESKYPATAPYMTINALLILG